MKPFTKYLIGGCMALLILTGWQVSRQGWGLSTLTDKHAIQDRRTDCQDRQKDRFGNCPPRTHRVRFGGYRSHFGGGGK